MLTLQQISRSKIDMIDKEGVEDKFKFRVKDLIRSRPEEGGAVEVSEQLK